MKQLSFLSHHWNTSECFGKFAPKMFGKCFICTCLLSGCCWDGCLASISLHLTIYNLKATIVCVWGLNPGWEYGGLSQFSIVLSQLLRPTFNISTQLNHWAFMACSYWAQHWLFGLGIHYSDVYICAENAPNTFPIMPCHSGGQKGDVAIQSVLVDKSCHLLASSWKTKYSFWGLMSGLPTKQSNTQDPCTDLGFFPADIAAHDTL